MSEETTNVSIEDESLSDEQLEDVSGGADWEQLRQDTLDRNSASRLDEIREENLEKH
jgi:hypothetical protein